MINTLLVLVSLSVYTFDVSKTMFSRKDLVSMSMRARNACRRDKRWLRGFGVPAQAWCGYATETLSLMEEFTMRVFVTGATGFIGSATVRELIEAGHRVLGLARSDAAAASLASVGAEVHRGSLEDLDSLRSGAAASDGVIHTAFIHDFSDFASDFARACEVDQRAIETLGAVLAGSDRPLVVASGTAALPGRLVTEEDTADLNLESAPTGSRLHAVGDEGVPVREIACVIGRRLGVPVVALPVEEAGSHFGFLGPIFSLDCPASSTLTQQRLGWHPVQPGLLADLDQDYYYRIPTPPPTKQSQEVTLPPSDRHHLPQGTFHLGTSMKGLLPQRCLDLFEIR
jgi:hypothetical protein